MTTNVKFLRSTDKSAPSLNGQVSSLITVLDAVLVNGYNSISVTLTRANSTVTVTGTNHGFKADQCILISGADQSEYNGEFYVDTIIDSDNFTFVINTTPATPATGTITCKIAPLGWTKVYSGTNLAAYRAPGGNQAYLRVDDTIGTYVKVCGYLNMTDVNTGTDQFPTTAQTSNGVYWYKSNTADATARVWSIVGNDRSFYLQTIGSAVSNGTYTNIVFFGDFKSYKTNDTYNIGIIGATNTTPYGTVCGISVDHITTASAGHYICRSYTGLGGSITFSKHGNYSLCPYNYSGYNSSTFPYPSPVDGNIYVIPFYIAESSAIVVRGELPGCYFTPHNLPFINGDTFDNGSDKKFVAWREGNTSTNYGELFIEISNTWVY